MPCYSITTVSLKLMNANLDVLKKALEALGHRNVYQSGTTLYWGRNSSYNQKTGQLTVESEQEGKAIKQGYSGQLVRKNASKFGWQVKQVSQNKFQIVKR